jgi:hypothetical protein
VLAEATEQRVEEEPCGRKASAAPVGEPGMGLSSSSGVCDVVRR